MVYAVKRVYEPPEAEDGLRVLVDRLWPRGVAKARARIDLWIRDLAPSDVLRKWYGHEPARWAEFRRRYAAELRGHRALFQPLIEAAKTRRVTLLFSSRELKLNNAFALKAMLESAARAKKRVPSGTKRKPAASRAA